MKIHLFAVAIIAAILSACVTDSKEMAFIPGLHTVEVTDFEPEYQTKVDETGKLVKAPVPDKCIEHERKVNLETKEVTAGDCISWLVAGKQRKTKGLDTALGAAVVLGSENQHESVHAYGALGAYGRGMCSDPIDCALLNAGAVAPTVLVPGTTGTTAPADGKKVDELAKSVDKQGKALKVFGEALDEHIVEEEKK